MQLNISHTKQTYDQKESHNTILQTFRVHTQSPRLPRDHPSRNQRPCRRCQCCRRQNDLRQALDPQRVSEPHVVSPLCLRRFGKEGSCRCANYVDIHRLIRQADSLKTKGGF